jgi:imidazolonepropionase-like amidohydrolase
LVFSPRDLVTILTRNAAIALGLGDETGTLEAGKLADIIIIDGDPLADIHAVLDVEVVIKEGRIVVDKR